jgi:xanthine permease XanP
VTVPVRKPAGLVYGVEERPTTTVSVVSALQHVGVIAIFIVYPLIVAHQAAMDTDAVANLLRMAMAVLAIAATLQALSAGPIGSRFLAPAIFTGIYLAPSLAAARFGGMPLVWGMTIFAGVIEALLSRVWTRLRAYIPPESAGLVVFLVGVIISLAAFRVLLQDGGGHLSRRDLINTVVTLAVMAGLNVWTLGAPRLFCILIGMVTGYMLAAASGAIRAADIAHVAAQPFFAAPSLAGISWAFDWSMAVPFAISALAAAMNTTAVITSYQRLNDADWVRPEMRSISRGILGDAIAAIAAGLLGTYGLTVSSANVGVVAATGVASRRIAFIVSAILLVLAFQPALIGVLAIMPPPVMAAAMLFTSVFIMISGIQIISSRILDSRRTLVIGMGMIAFFAASIFPAAFAAGPDWLQPLVASPLVLATIVALLLNLIFRLGVHRRAELTIDPSTVDPQAITDFIERNAAMWGARRDVISRVEHGIAHLVDTVIHFYHSSGMIRLAVSYDEFDVEATLAYAGRPFLVSETRPTLDEIADTDDGHLRFTGYMLLQSADTVRVTEEFGNTLVRLHYL